MRIDTGTLAFKKSGFDEGQARMMRATASGRGGPSVGFPFAVFVEAFAALRHSDAFAGLEPA
jgi:hypothetical protein